MSNVARFEDLRVWQRSRALNKEIYEISSRGKFARDYALRDQIRRASISISSNIAEGHERGGNKEYLNFLFIAKASAGEVRSQLWLAMDLGYVDKSAFERLNAMVVEISQMIYRLIMYLRGSDFSGSKYKDPRTGSDG